MTSLRALIRNRRRLALGLLIMAFAIKAVFPAGFMIASSPGTYLTVTICTDASGGLATMQLLLPAEDTQSGHADSAKSEQCAFSGLAKLATFGADAALIAALLAFILVLGRAPVRRLSFGQIFHLRPPLRGPPAAA